MNCVLRSTSLALAMLCLLFGSESAAIGANRTLPVLFGPVVPAPWLVTDACPRELLDNAWIVAPGRNLPLQDTAENAVSQRSFAPNKAAFHKPAAQVVTAEGAETPAEIKQTQHVAPAVAEVVSQRDEADSVESPTALVLFPPEPADWLVVSPFAGELDTRSSQNWLAISEPVENRPVLDNPVNLIAQADHRSDDNRSETGEITTAHAYSEDPAADGTDTAFEAHSANSSSVPGLIAPASLQRAGMTSTGQLAFASDCVGSGDSCLSSGNCTEQVCCFEMRFLLSDPELAPLEAISPRLRRRAYEKNPFQNVLIYEAMPNVSQHVGPRCETNVEYRNTVPELNQVHLKKDVPVAEMRLSTAPEPGRMPEARSFRKEAGPVLVHVPGTTRGWCPQQMHWNASEATHAPLYFEDIALERSGYSRGYLQPFVSGVKFFTTVPLLPGLMTIDPPLSTEYALGEVEPGSIVPYTAREPEWTYKAIAVEAGAVLGLAFLIP